MKRNLRGIKKFIDDLGFFIQYVDEVVIPRIQNRSPNNLERAYLESAHRAEALIATLQQIIKIAKEEEKIKVILT